MWPWGGGGQSSGAESSGGGPISQRVDDAGEQIEAWRAQAQTQFEEAMMPASARDDVRRAVDQAEVATKSLGTLLASSPPLLVATTLSVGAATYGIYRRYFRRLPTAAHFTPSTLRWRSTLVGKCTSVGDADGFRLYHTPGPPLYRDLMYSSVPAQRSDGGGGSGSSSSSLHGSHPPHTATISIRLAGADAPELAHFGRPAQPFAKEAKDELQRLVLGKTVWCQMAHVDQYQRLVATPYVWAPPFVLGRTNVSLHLVKKGLATVYTQGGAAYGVAGPAARFARRILGGASSSDPSSRSFFDARAHLVDRLLPLSGEARLKRAMARAKRRRIGLWSQRHIETPEEYKRRGKSSS